MGNENKLTSYKIYHNDIPDVLIKELCFKFRNMHVRCMYVLSTAYLL